MSLRVLFAVALLAANAVNASAASLGLWQLNGSLDDQFSARPPLAVLGDWTPSYNVVDIGGSSATVLSFPAFYETQALQMPNSAAVVPTDEWTIVMDVSFPTITGFTSLWQTDQNIGDSDGDFFIGGDGGIGIDGDYDGTVAPNTWKRIAVVGQHVGDTFYLDKYLDGAFVGTTAVDSEANGRFAVGDVLNLFTDDDGETAPGRINSLAFFDNNLKEWRIANLGGATAGGIPAVPEPSALALLGVGALVIAARRRVART